ncbi:hypothetical protein GCK72_020897 [Caenorhabditis remanei]|uniref:Receptor L-domain domain-containing protein n=1 Tax=Caenorhabditis remanei TaxID=31234 RepID=A0A6A5GGJ0_CAERE|nr:hypothetical protein GCK72_020897 [Caenorhabditis remanei]KAF1754337.1 hypothetical protein GCK72_020897 [Caenorhabditis remanei]
MDSTTLPLFPTTCSSVCANLLIDQSSDVTEDQLSIAFKHLKVLYGFLHIIDTNFSNIKFLSGLETVECYSTPENEKSPPDSMNMEVLVIEDNQYLTEIGMTNFTSTSCALKIWNPAKFSRLNVPNLKNFYTIENSTTTEIKHRLYGSPDFCLTIGEITHFVNSQISHLSFKAVPCKLSETSGISSIDGEKICEIEKFSLQTFDTSCQRVSGHIVIGPGDEKFVWKMENVTWIYGTILVKLTNLTDIDCFGSLEYVIHGWDIPAGATITIRYNANLLTARFPRLKRIVGHVEIMENNKNMIIDHSLCYGVNYTEKNQMFFPTDCGEGHFATVPF